MTTARGVARFDCSGKRVSILERIEHFVRGSSGYAWLDRGAGYRDPAAGGLNPNWYRHTDDGSDAAWTKVGCSVTPGISDPNGGTSAWTLVADNAASSERIQQTASTFPVQRASARLALRARVPGTGGTSLVITMFTTTSVASTGVVESGPGTITVSGLNWEVKGLSTTQWTVVRVTSNAAITAGSVTPLYYAGAAGQDAAEVDIFRPTLQVLDPLGLDDGLQHYTGATAGGLVGTYRDMVQGLDLVQGTAAKKPYCRYDSATGRMVWVFDGVDDAMTAALTSTLAQPGAVYWMGKPSSGTTSLFDGTGATNRWYLSTLSDAFRYWAGTFVSGGSMPAGSEYLVAAVFNGASSASYVNGALAGSGDPGSKSLDAITVGANYPQSAFGAAAVRAVLIVPGATAYDPKLANLLNAYFRNPVTL